MTKRTGFLKSVGTSVLAFSNAIGSIALDTISELAKQEKQMKLLEFKSVKKDFDAVMNDRLDNEEIFEEGVEILKNHRLYSIDKTIESMKQFIEKHTNKAEEMKETIEAK